MYRPSEEQWAECPVDCLQVLSNFLTAAQAYVAHLGTLRPKNRFKKDDDLHGRAWVVPAHVGQGVLPESFQAPGQHHPLQQEHPNVYDAYCHRYGMSHVPVYSDIRREQRTYHEAGRAESILAHECAARLLFLWPKSAALLLHVGLNGCLFVYGSAPGPTARHRQVPINLTHHTREGTSRFQILPGEFCAPRTSKTGAPFSFQSCSSSPNPLPVGHHA